MKTFLPYRYVLVMTGLLNVVVCKSRALLLLGEIDSQRDDGDVPMS